MRGRRVAAALLLVAAAHGFYAPGRRRAATKRHILDNSNDDPIARFERENDGAKVFEKLVEYPCDFTIKVIGKDDPEFATDMVALLARVVEKPADGIEFSTAASGKGTYLSVTIRAPVASADQLYQCYAVLRNDPRVRIAL
mmetsp:Transcript_27065/g.83389  ORF Transcript_27065/g.83389 Transcript_27065/m.83389 type:complete len:141 (+) Transcript_27065:876-1298(+)